MRKLVQTSLILVAGLTVLAATGQLRGQQAAPKFDVISIKPSNLPAGTNPFDADAPGLLPDGHYMSPYATVYDLVKLAFDADPESGALLGLPLWTRTERFAVEAKPAPGPAPGPAQIKLMMQSLLADRCGLQYKTETRDMDVYFLRQANGGIRNLKAADPGHKAQPILLGYGGAAMSIVGYGITMRDLARSLGWPMGRPVIDQTGLGGTYDIYLPPAPQPTAQPGDPRESFSSIATRTLQEDFGLRLAPGKAAVDVVQIEHISRPTPNN